MKHTPWHQNVHPPPRPSPDVWLPVDNTQRNNYCRNFIHDCTIEVQTEPLKMIHVVLFASFALRILSRRQ